MSNTIYGFNDSWYRGFYNQNCESPEDYGSQAEATIVLGNQILLASLVIAEAINTLSTSLSEKGKKSDGK